MFDKSKLPPLTIAAFREWLQKQPMDAEFQRAHSFHCPIAEYVDHGLRVHSVDGYGIYDDTCEKVAPLPCWAKRFIAKYDSASHQSQPGKLQEVLRHLEEVENELAANPEPI